MRPVTTTVFNADTGSLRRAFRARYVFPVTTPPIADGVVTVENGAIVHVDREATGSLVTDLGNVALLPALINAHTHLELSGLTAPLGTPGMPFTDWVRLVVAYRRQAPAYEAHLVRGQSECASLGQAVVGDVATTLWTGAGGLVEPTLFHETIGLRRGLLAERLAAARDFLAFTRKQGLRAGLCPHAPYSVHPELFDGLLRLAAAESVPLAFHLAETREELELLATGGGPFRELLHELNAWEDAAIAPGTRPIDYLRRLAAVGVRALIIHGNYLDDDEIGLLAAHADRISVVYCPRTHAFFGHSRHPLARLLAAGANVAVGTDSRASNPDLNLFEELRLIARCYPELTLATVLELATLRSARALQIDARLGSLEPGKVAVMATLSLPDSGYADPHELLFATDAQPSLLFDGQQKDPSQAGQVPGRAGNRSCLRSLDAF